MTINYTSLLGLAQPVTGTEANTWGTVVNDEITALIEEAIAGGETINVTAGNVTLTDTDGVPNQARNAILLITGTPGTSRNVIAPSTSKTYVVVNDSDSSVVIKGSATTGVTITAGDKALVAWNGSDFVRVGASAGGSNTQVQYNNNGNLAGSANMTFNGTRLTVNDFADSSLTAGRVTYATTSGNLTDSSTFTFDGSFLTVPGLKNSGLTSGRVTYATTNGQLTDAAGLTFNGTTLTATAGSFGDVTLTAQGDVRFADSDSSNYVAFQAPATVASNVTWTLPATDGTSGQFLSTDGAGILSWATASGGGGGGGTSVTVTQATATASQTTFNVTYTVGQLSVFLNGALLASADYTASNGTTVVLATGAASGDIFTALAYSSVTSISQLNTNVTVSDSGTNGTITFTTDGTEAMRINNSQNVGIGTNSISGDYFSGRLLQITGSSSAAIKFERTSATARKWEIGVTTGGNLDFADAVASTSVPRMRIDTSGNVVIGTTSSSSGKLHVEATTTSSVYATADAGYAIIDAATNSSGARFNVSGGTSVQGVTLWGYNSARNAYTPINYGASFHKFMLGSTEAARIGTTGSFVVNTTDGKGVVTNGGTTIDYGSGGTTGIYTGGGTGNPGYGWGFSTLAGLGSLSNGAALAGGYFVGCTGISNVGGGAVGVYAKGGTGTVYGQSGAGIYAEAGTDYGASTTSNYAIACRAYSYGVLYVDRRTNDGTLVSFNQDGTEEGTISVSGTTVSYNGGHLSRWSQLLDGSKDESILKGTVMSNLDEMCVWEKPAAYYTEYEEQNRTEDMPQFKAGDLKTPAEQSSNEQCNKTKVSDVEGDKNVAGVFVAWTYDDVHQTNDMLLGMTGDMVIRIGAGVVVQRGDLLISAGNGTAKPQADDIRRSSTVAKVTSTHVSCTYPDGSYCVPCVLMAC